MMKKVFFLLAMFTCIFASCSDGGNEEPVVPPTQQPEVNNTPTITIDPTIQSSGLSFDTSASEKSITFSTTSDWTLAIAETRSGTEWCTASPTSGGKGTATVKFKTTENTDAEDRSVAVTIKAGTASKTFTVTQKGNKSLLVTTKKYELPKEGGEIEIEVKSNVEYEMTIAESAKEWITEATGRALTTHKHILAIAASEEAVKREGEITFKSGDIVETVKVYQAGEAVLLLSKNEFTVSEAGETISVDIKSNVDFGVQMPNVDWIKEEASGRGMSSHTLKFVVAENESYDTRSTEIIFYDKNSDLKNTLKVTQSAKEILQQADVTINVTEAGTLRTHIAEDRIKTLTSVKITGDLNGDDFSVILRMKRLEFLDLSEANVVDGGEIPTKRNILSVRKEGEDSKRKGIIPSTVKCFYMPHNLLEIRGESKIIKGWEDGVSGERYEVWGAYSPFNSSKYMSTGADYQELVYSDLEHLELSNELKIIGDGAFIATGLTKINIPESVDSIKKLAFYGCHNLSEVVFQNSTLRLIEDEAFRRCYKLTEIILPNGLEEIGYRTFYECGHGKIDLPSSIKKIGKDAFSIHYDNIPESTNVHIADLKSWINVELGNIFSSPFYLNQTIQTDRNGQVNSLLYHNNKLITLLEINDNENVGNYVFAGCKSLEKVTIGNKVVSIGIESFRDCENIIELTLGDNVKMISQGAFKYCDKLDKITLGANVDKVEKEAFGNTKPSEVYCYATTPPEIIASSNFNKINKETAKLYVPSGTYSAYYLSDWGSIFTNIIEMEE